MKKEQTKKLLFRFLFPHPALTTVIVVISAILLALIFIYNVHETFYAPVVYAFSFYALCILTARTVVIIRNMRKRVKSHEHFLKFSNDHELKTRLSMRLSLIINLLFALFKLIAGIYYQSAWFIQVSVYYFILILIRIVLVTRDSKTLDNDRKLLIHQWKTYRLCGKLLFFLNAAVSVMVVRVIWQNKGFSDPGFIIYAMAAYTFYRFIIAIIKLVKSKHSNPVLLSAKALDLSIALMSMFSLQTAMLTSFGAETSQSDRFFLNAFTGLAVCTAIVCIAVVMLYKSNKKIKNITLSSEENI